MELLTTCPPAPQGSFRPVESPPHHQQFSAFWLVVSTYAQKLLSQKQWFSALAMHQNHLCGFGK